MNAAYNRPSHPGVWEGVVCTNYSPAKVERLRVLFGLGPPLD